MNRNMYSKKFLRKASDMGKRMVKHLLSFDPWFVEYIEGAAQGGDGGGFNTLQEAIAHVQKMMADSEEGGTEVLCIVTPYRHGLKRIFKAVNLNVEEWDRPPKWRIKFDHTAKWIEASNADVAEHEAYQAKKKAEENIEFELAELLLDCE